MPAPTAPTVAPTTAGTSAPPSLPDVTPPKRDDPHPSPNAGIGTGGAGAFDGAAAARALAAVDLSGCNAPPGTSGHVTVSFSPDGHAKSEIDSGSTLSATAASCIRARYDATRIPSFDGAKVKTGKSFFIPSN